MKLLQSTTEVQRAIELYDEFDKVLEEVKKEYHAKMATSHLDEGCGCGHDAERRRRDVWQTMANDFA